ncbi:hypothetical protein WICMUC_001721 [Wickerhamomyces mucosus]|uniref:Uncharacterized protein n=1 Tax=Wickerhamomyces mucosus TaxID=1378264 RepID=A0A9P8PSN9_9ASCO|nr:hypothetical protein WICMUC_001721 [Wickerhamomyces mucosus]
MSIIEEKVVFITGASAGIGFALATEFAKRPGYKVYAGARSVKKMDPLKDAGVHVLEFDVTKSESIIAARDRIVEENDGRLDILYNNAGISVWNSVFDLTQEELKYAFQVNVFGVVETIKAFQLPLLKTKGTVVFTSSVADHIPLPFLFAYAGSKISFTSIAKALAGETGHLGIKVLVIRTGLIDSEMTNKPDEEIKYPPKDSVFYLEGKSPVFITTGKKMTPTLQYAKTVINDVEKFRKGRSYYKELYRGESSKLAWFFGTFFSFKFILTRLYPKFTPLGNYWDLVNEKVNNILNRR